LNHRPCFAGILCPTIIRGYAHADRTKGQGDLQPSALRWKTFKVLDFGDYPVDHTMNQSGASMGLRYCAGRLLGQACSRLWHRPMLAVNHILWLRLVLARGFTVNDGNEQLRCIASRAWQGNGFNEYEPFHPDPCTWERRAGLQEFGFRGLNLRP